MFENKDFTVFKSLSVYLHRQTCSSEQGQQELNKVRMRTELKKKKKMGLVITALYNSV